MNLIFNFNFETIRIKYRYFKHFLCVGCLFVFDFKKQSSIIICILQIMESKQFEQTFFAYTLSH